jgi:hypothetical protein
MSDEKRAELKKRVDQFNALELPGQSPMMHMGTSYLVNDLWREVKRVAKENKRVVDDCNERLRKKQKQVIFLQDNTTCLSDERYRYKEELEANKAVAVALQREIKDLRGALVMVRAFFENPYEVPFTKENLLETINEALADREKKDEQ